MSKIKVLAPDQALKIAAGEVIERPAHVVKELVENSLDAGATAISIFIEDAGKKLIRIVDNGCGMGQQDALLCFLPHATSKIEHVDQLENISSFGFRGEALASVSAISKTTLTTKLSEASSQDLGTQICYQGAIFQEQKSVACSHGTDIAIADLFFNIPVRKKFLKQDETEWNAIQTLIYAFCFSNPSVHFKLYRDNRLILNAPPLANPQDRALQVWGNDIFDHLITLNTEEAEHQMSLKIQGYITGPHFFRYGRQNLFFFVNNRWIKNTDLGKALMKGYSHVLPPDKFPAAVIFVSIEQKYVDVNIHPKKEEVRFFKPGLVAAAITHQVQKTLEGYLNTKLENIRATQQPNVVNLEVPEKPWQQPFITPQQINHNMPFTAYPLPEWQTKTTLSNPGSQWPSVGYETQRSQEVPYNGAQQPIVQEEPYVLVGQLWHTYIVIEKDEEVIFIDQHAAHERIWYERYKKNFTPEEGTTLLFPEVVKLSHEQAIALMQHKDFFDKHGIQLDLDLDGSVVIKTSPPFLQSTSLRELIEQAAQFIADNEHTTPESFDTQCNDHLHAQMACKRAIKAGDILTTQQMHQLIKDLQQVEHRFICAHGRPTIWTLSKNALEKHFRRC